ncbi:MAG: hypothetical protein HYS27_27245 [Deltaproteobacteria bacterium]|nr:hypothetical protein [Deltaproteobacteria bacterium]
MLDAREASDAGDDAVGVRWRPDPRRKDPLRWLWLLPVLVLAAVLTLGELADPDIWWNTAAGDWWWRHGGAPPLSLYGAHGCPDALPIEVPFAHLVIGAFHLALGLPGLVLLRFLGVGAAALVMFHSLARRVPAPWAALATSLALCALAPRYSVRGELFSLALLPLVIDLGLSLVEDQAASRRAVGLRVAALFTVGALWPRLHGAFPLGVLALVALGLGVVLERARGNLTSSATTRAAVAFLALLGGVATAPDALGVFADGAAERDIARVLGFREWQATVPALWHGGARPSTVALLALVSSWLPALGAWRTPGALPRLLLPLPVIAIAFDVVRGAALPVLTCAAWLPLLAAPIRARLRTSVAAAGALVVLATVVVQVRDNPPLAALVDPVRLVPTRLTAVHAARTLDQTATRGRLLAPLHLSNWFILTAADRIEVLWSGRRTYSVPCLFALQAAVDHPRQGFDQARARFAFDLVLLELGNNDELLRVTVERGWRLLHLDLRYAVLAAPERADAPAFAVPSTETLLAQEGLVTSSARAPGLLVRACERLAFLGRHDDAARVCAAAGALAPQ